MSGAGRADRAEDPGLKGRDAAAEPGAAASADGTSSPDAAAEDAASPDAAAEDAAAEGKADSTAPAATGSGGGRRAGRRPRRKRSFWREFPILVVVALLLAVVIKTYAIQAFFIPSGSMENTLEINDRVLVNKLVYDVRGLHRGDIVVFDGDGSWDPGPVPADKNFLVKFADGFASMFGFGHPGDILIKRVIGLPGDHVACCDTQDRVTVNGVPLSEKPYLYPGGLPSESRFSITVPPGRLWVMGDHRLISDDSRDHLGDPGSGTIPQNAVVGRAFVIIWPPSRWRFLPIPATFEQPRLNATAAAGARTGTGTNGAAANQLPAGLLSARLEPSSPALPLTAGFAAAIPLTWLQRRIRTSPASRRARRRLDRRARREDAD
jgi:signal peptidase I